MKALVKYETILTAQLYLKIFSRTTSLSKYLQTEGMYLLQAPNLIDSTVDVLKKKSRNFGDVLDAAKLFVSWANNELKAYGINLVVEEVLPTLSSKEQIFLWT